MKEMDILRAIGSVPEEYLTDSESCAVCVTPSRKIWRVGLVAAAICLLTVTALAAPAIIRGLKGGTVNLREYFYLAGGEGCQRWVEHYSICEFKLLIDVQPEAPKTLEAPCAPKLFLENYEPTRCVWKKYEFCYWTKYYFENGDWTDIRFDQYAIPEPNADGSYTVPIRLYGEEKMIQVGDVDVLQVFNRYDVTQSESGKDFSVRQLYWSDGKYIYCLYLRADVPRAFYEGLISNLQPISDVSHYLTEKSNLSEPIHGPAPTTIYPEE